MTPINSCATYKYIFVILQPISSCLIMNTLPKQVKQYIQRVQGMQDPYREGVMSSELEQTMKYVGFQPHHGERYNGEHSY